MDQLVGVGLRSKHYPYLEEHRPKTANWFEAISENYMDSLGRPREILRKVRKDFPVGLHGVSMSLATEHELDVEYLKRLRVLVDEIDPIVVSDHLCWTGLAHSNMHDLLPFPLTKKSLDRVVEHIDCAQNVLGRQMLIENVSVYMTFEQSVYTETEFIVQATKRAGAKILLDVNNLYVNAQNFGFSAAEALRSIPAERIGQVHLAGFSDCGDFLFDTHSMPVYDEVWDLFSQLAPKLHHVPVLVEWDDDIPEFAVLENEVKKARAILERPQHIHA